MRHSLWARLAMAVAIVGAVGCQHEKKMQTATLHDMSGETPANVNLPPGFAPLKMHAGNSGDDSYGPWPRYIVSEKDNMVMVYVPTQTFMMGGGTGPDEVPARQVVVDHFYIDLHEVTNIQYHKYRLESEESCKHPGHHHPEAVYDQQIARSPQEAALAMLEVEHGMHAAATPSKDKDFYKDYWKPGLNNDHPVRNVSWREAWTYSKWAGKVLPSESQWEAAARGTDRRIYPWGNGETVEQTRYLLNCKTGREDFDGYEYTAPVLNFAAGVSPAGAFNMSGNVWEWTADNYDPGRYAYPSSEDPPSDLVRGTKSFGDPNYPNSLQKETRRSRVGPMRGDERVIRGGSFADPIEMCRVDTRDAARPDSHVYNVGFRSVLPLPPDTRY